MEFSSSDEDEVATEVGIQEDVASGQVTVNVLNVESVLEEDSDSSFRGFTTEDIGSVLFSDISENDDD